MRESIQESGIYARDYQAELKLTNKYAQRFGMDESDQHHASLINQQMNNMSRHSGNMYMMHGGGANPAQQQSSSNIQATYERNMHRESQQFESQNNPMYRSSASNSSYINRQVAYQAP